MPEATSRRDVVPGRVAALVGDRWGVELDDVPVVRGRAAGARAAELSARAFTVGGAVHLPDDAGELSDPAVQALLAHELTHVAQQQAFGADLPAAESEDGRRLEEAATSAEQWFRSGAPLVHRPIARQYIATTDTDRVQAAPVSTAMSWSLPEAPIAQGESAAEASPIEQDVDGEFAWPSELDWPEPTVRPDPNVHERLELLEESVQELQDRPAASPDDLVIQLDDPGVLTRLAERLYTNFRHRLRAELLIDRERRGALADLR
ncbi:eCIS core domain-containing protein [Kribbella sp. NPDC055071]